MKKLILAIFFLLQIIWIVKAVFSPVKYFGWVPYDQISTYQIEVIIDTVILSRDEISDRYNLPNPGRENRAISHVFSQISQFEKTYGVKDSAQVTVKYQINGKKEEAWILRK